MRNQSIRNDLKRIVAVSPLLIVVLALAQPALAGTVGGTLEVGKVYVEKTAGDASTMPEFWEVYDGLNFSRLNFDGTTGNRTAFHLDVRDLSAHGGQGLFTCRVADLGSFSVRHHQSRQLYSADDQVRAERHDWNFSANVTPSPKVRFTAEYGRQAREGDRWATPDGTISALGTGYDYLLQTRFLEGEYRGNGRMFAVGLEGSSLTDDLHAGMDRSGSIISARASLPCLLFPGKVTHFVRASYGTQGLDHTGIDCTTSAFQYFGTVRASDDVDLRYRFDASRIKSDTTHLQTDRLRNDVDVTWRHAKGSFFAGYGYATTDDDKTLTDTNTWRVGGAYHDPRWQLRASYATSEKNDQESLTLLKDVESSRWRASAQAKVNDRLTVGGAFLQRDRDYPILDVTASGKRYSGFTRLAIAEWGTASVEYAYSDDQYVDQVGAYRADNSTVTARVDLTGVKRLRLGGGVTYLDLGKDMDVEKSIVTFDGKYDLNKDYFVSVRYNVYNYDDFVLLDRYFTTNVVSLNVGYKLPVD